MSADGRITAESPQDSYKNYADYNGVLRTWFVSFGLGALVLFMLHPDLVSLLRERGHFLIVVFLFLIGCFAQIVVALINKFSSWHIYDAAKKGVAPGKVTEFFYNAFAVDKLIDVLTVLFFLAAISLMVFDFVLTTKPLRAAVTPEDFRLQAACAEGAAKSFQRSGLEVKAGDFYKNHWNRKQGKCFVQMNSIGKNNFLSIDVYDVFENKRYATFVGHQHCDVAVVGARECQFDTATVWLDGNDEREQGDYNFGFNGLGRGGVGSEATRTEFLKYTHSFMVD